MKHLALGASLLAIALVASGCQWVPRHAEQDIAEQDQCLTEIPTLEENACMLAAWVDFGLAAQRGDSEWRQRILEEADGLAPRQRLARAVVLSWAGRDHWKDASELYKADLALAPSSLQPLLRQWLNGLEARRALAGELADSERSRRQVSRERDSLAKKLDALTAIEESINSRQQ
ncbi:MULTISPECIES: hypothetical protein [Modicisalibacter]|uniref:hypothetical protein n=1 Tax=Modicisalibacter TaxID=574347 RepID=UPI00100A7F30|nr:MULTISPECIES: hypothetical protein [Halomonadaceae]MBZ9559468.1 hypothetical protein [Modicisalibacter sp. R2A 31.J]MBZ9576366.1 hypothetical protein [Modicisalibacter sp. MOD 31.J]